MSRRRVRRTEHPRASARGAAHVVEGVERRVLLSAAARFTPDPITGNAPTTFSWNVATQGGQVEDFAHAQRGLYDAGAANIADEVFLKLTGIPGEATDAKHLGEIDVTGFEWGGDHVVAGPGPQFSELHVTAPVSKASPLLMHRAATGAVITDADLVVRNAGGSQVEYYKVFLDGARVSSYRVNTGARGGTYDDFTLTFARAQVEYRQPGPTAPVTFDWNVAQQGRAVQDFAPAQRADLHAPTLAGSDDRFLRLDGIPGESTDGKHPNAIELRSFDWSLDSIVTTAGAQPRFNEIHLTAFTSKASPLLMQRTASGATIPSGDLTLRRGGGTQAEYYRLHLADVHVASYEVSPTVVAGRLVE